ncbi:unnamed protein product, partial [marine sediment metagenome]
MFAPIFVSVICPVITFAKVLIGPLVDSYPIMDLLKGNGIIKPDNNGQFGNNYHGPFVVKYPAF